MLAGLVNSTSDLLNVIALDKPEIPLPHTRNLIYKLPDPYFISDAIQNKQRREGDCSSAPIGRCSIPLFKKAKFPPVSIRDEWRIMKGKMFSLDRFIYGVRSLWLTSHPRSVEEIGIKQILDSLRAAVLVTGSVACPVSSAL